MCLLIFGIVLDVVSLFGMKQMLCGHEYAPSGDKCWQDSTYRLMRTMTLLGLGYNLFNLHIFKHILKAV